MTARFILSLDCEGKWGVADHLEPAHHRTLGEARLREAYDGLLELLDACEIPATFAFVGTFAMPAEALRRFRPALEQLAARAPDYLRPALADMDEGSRQGWTGDWALEAVDAARQRHELALHGVTHVPWGGVDEAFAREEFKLFHDARSPLAQLASTYIYPRNQVAHQAVLAEHGIAGVRLAPPARSRVASLLSEFDLDARPEPNPPLAEPIAIPAGFFVNWLSGARRVVPPVVSRLRARRLLARAERTGEVVHYWTHPENVASAPATLDLLRGILEDVACLRDAGRCEVLTQANYCARLAPERVRPAAARRDMLAGRLPAVA